MGMVTILVINRVIGTNAKVVTNNTKRSSALRMMKFEPRRLEIKLKRCFLALLKNIESEPVVVSTIHVPGKA